MTALALPISSRVELALDADLSAVPQSWTWTESTYGGASRLMEAQEAVITRGQSDESGNIEPGSIDLLLENRDGALTPRHPLATTPLHRGMPLRFSIKAGLPYLALTGAASSRAGTPDAASLDITGDWAIAVELEAPVYLPASGGAYEVTGKFNVAGNRSILLYWLSDGKPRLKWSTDGTNELTATATVAMPRPIVGTLCVAAWLDVNDGAGGHKVRFYAAPTLAALVASPSTYQIGADTNSGAGTTSVFASTAPLDIGDVTGSGFAPFPGQVRKAQYRAGDFATGVIQANPDFTAQVDGATSFSDGIRTWTVNNATVQRWRTRFLGQITDIKPVWAYGDIDGLARVKVEAAGVLQRRQHEEEPIESALYRTVTAPINTSHVHAYFPLEDGRDATSIFSPVGGQPGGVLTANLAGDDSLPSSSPLPSVSGGQSYGWNLPFTPDAPASGWAGTWLLNLAVQPTGGEILDQRIDTIGGTTTQWVLRMDASGYILFAKDRDDVNVLSAGTGSASQMYGNWMIVTLFLTQNGANIDWQVDMTPLAGPSVGISVGSSGTLASYTLGQPVRFRSLSSAAPGDGFSIGHFMITSGVATGWLAPADTAYVGETAANRVARLCREQNIPYVIEGDADSSEPMGPQRPLELTKLLVECQRADLGRLTELPNTIGIGYRCHNDLINQPAAFTVDADLNLDIPFEANEDDQRLVNDFKATRTDGSSYQAIDQAHIDAEDHYPKGETVNVAYDWQLPDYAGRRLHEGTWPEMRYPDVPVNLVADSAMHDAWLNADIGDVFALTGLPDEHPTPTASLLLEGYTESISSDNWDLSLDNGPAGPLDAGVVEDPVLGRAGTDGSVIDTAINSSATSVDVAVTAGEMWTTSGGQFPFDAVAGGEEWTVSAIAASLVTFGAAGTASHQNNASVTPGTPASIAAGNLLLVFAAIRNSGAGVPDTPAGYTRLPVFPADSNAQLFAKIAVGGDTAPTITFTGGVANADTSAQMIRLGGKWHDPANIAVAWGDSLNASAQDIAYPATRIVTDNCIVLYLGWKQDDWTSVATIAGATEIGEPSTITGNDQGIVWDYVIQTTAASIAAGSFVVTGGAAAISRGAVIALRCDKQTWTVTRSVNGVVKSQTAGTAVQLADPMYAA